MKIKVCISKEVEIEANEKIFNDLYEIHKADPNAIGTEEQYDEAVKKISEIMGMPIMSFNKIKPNTEYIFGVYAKDDVPILEI